MIIQGKIVQIFDMEVWNKLTTHNDLVVSNIIVTTISIKNTILENNNYMQFKILQIFKVD